MISPELSPLTAELEKLIRQFEVGEMRDRLIDAAEPRLVCGPVFHELLTGYLDRIQKEYPEALSFSSLGEWDRHVCDSLPLGATRAGGMPDLPPSIEWPQHEGQLLPFIAQVNLSELPRIPRLALPGAGWLSFFGAAGTVAPDVVFHHACAPGELVRQPRPTTDRLITDWACTSIYQCVPVRNWVVAPSLPGIHCGWWPQHGDHYDFWDAVENLGPPEPVMRIGGHPTRQSVESQQHYGGLDPGDWTLLLELESVGTMRWSDIGVLQYFIRPQDLSRGDYSRVCARIICS